MQDVVKPATGRYKIDPVHSSINFGIRHVMVSKVRGGFKKFSGSGFFDVDDVSKSELVVVIDAASIETGNSDRDNHLRSNDFFAMGEFPEIRFTSTSFEADGDGRYKVTGELAMKGVSKPITIELSYTGEAVDPYGNRRIGLEGSAVIDRTEWGVNYNAALESGGVLLGEKVSLEFDISATAE